MNEVLVALLRWRFKYVEVFILPESHWHNFCAPYFNYHILSDPKVFFFNDQTT